MAVALRTRASSGWPLALAQAAPASPRPPPPTRPVPGAGKRSKSIPAGGAPERAADGSNKRDFAYAMLLAEELGPIYRRLSAEQRRALEERLDLDLDERGR